MSGKRFNPLENPQASSSSDEDEQVVESSSEEEEEEDNDASSGDPAVKKPEIHLAAKGKNKVSDSESESEEETDLDTETERKVPVKDPGSSGVKSITETNKDSVAAKSQDSKKVKSCATKKRSSETDGAAASTEAKRVKRVSGEDEKKSGGGEKETKKTYFQRVWTEEDEIAVLQGIIDHKTDTGVSPFVDANGFYQSVKKSISFDVRKIQFTEKVRALKKKFENNRGKGKKGADPTFTKPHDRKAFELSKIIWGYNGLAPESAVKSYGKSKKSSKSKKVESLKQELVSSMSNGKSCEDDVANKGDASSEAHLDGFAKYILGNSLARFGVDDFAAQQGWSRLPSEDKKSFEEQWKQLQLKEFEFYSQKSGFIHAVVTKMVEAFRPSP